MLQLLTLIAFVLFMDFPLGLSTPLEDFNAYKSHYKKELCLGKDKVIASEDTIYIQHYAYNPTWVVECSILPITEIDTITLATSSKKEKSYIPVATLTFYQDGIKSQLTIYKSASSPHYFIPFRDASSGKETYGGGRYLDIPENFENHSSQGKITLDFNRAYNPYCAFTTGYNCPIPPANNHLTIWVQAGEKKFTKDQE